VLHEKRVERQPERLGQHAAQLLLGLLGGIGPHHPQPVRETVHVGVHRDGGDPVAEDEHAVGGLRSDPRKCRQLGERTGDVPAEPVEERLRARADRARFGTVEADRPDQRLDLAASGPSERPDVGEPAEQAARGDVRLFVAGPLGEDRPDQDLERVFGMVAQVRPAPVAGPVERREPVEQELPVHGARGGGLHRPASRRPEGTGGVRAVSVPGSERSGSSSASRGCISSPMR
jgi:hypothetical protein